MIPMKTLAKEASGLRHLRWARSGGQPIETCGAVASFDEVRDVFHAMLAGSLLLLIVSQGVRYTAGWWVYSAVEAAFFVCFALVLVPTARGVIRSWVFPRLMRPRRTLIVGSGPESRPGPAPMEISTSKASCDVFSTKLRSAATM